MSRRVRRCTLGASMLSSAQLDDLVAYITRKFDCVVMVMTVANDARSREVLRSLTAGVPSLSMMVEELRDTVGDTCVTIPKAFGALIVLQSRASSADVDRVSALALEATHAYQIQMLGGGRTGVDYLEGEERVVRSAHACVSSAFVRFMLTGVLPASPEAIVESLPNRLHLFTADDASFAAHVARSSLKTMQDGGVPPIVVCAVLWTWFQANAPEAIVPKHLRAAR